MQIHDYYADIFIAYRLLRSTRQNALRVSTPLYSAAAYCEDSEAGCVKSQHRLIQAAASRRELHYYFARQRYRHTSRHTSPPLITPPLPVAAHHIPRSCTPVNACWYRLHAFRAKRNLIGAFIPRTGMLHAIPLLTRAQHQKHVVAPSWGREFLASLIRFVFRQGISNYDAGHELRDWWWWLSRG